jgi:hypothetical protein
MAQISYVLLDVAVSAGESADRWRDVKTLNCLVLNNRLELDKGVVKKFCHLRLLH